MTESCRSGYFSSRYCRCRIGQPAILAGRAEFANDIEVVIGALQPEVGLEDRLEADIGITSARNTAISSTQPTIPATRA